MDTTDTVRASYLDLHLEIDNDWRFRMKRKYKQLCLYVYR